MGEETTSAEVQYEDGRTEIIKFEGRGIVELEEIPYEYKRIRRHNKVILFLKK